MKFSKIPLNPFVGLHPFSEDEAELFFGREKESGQILQKLIDKRFLAISGESCSGKTSLIRAGLISRLRAGFEVEDRANWLTMEFEPGKLPLENMAVALLDEFNDETNIENIQHLVRKMRVKGAQAILNEIIFEFDDQDTNLLFVVDRFEDIFRYGLDNIDETARQDLPNFISILLELSQQKLPIFIIILLRSDFLPDCKNYPELHELIDKNLFELRMLEEDALKQVIVKPVQSYGKRITAPLIQRLLDDIQAVDYKLPALQHVLMQTWEKWAETRMGPLDISHYEAVGTVENAVSLHAGEALTGMTEREKELTERLFRTLIYIDSLGRITCCAVYLSAMNSIIGGRGNEIAKIIDLFYSGGRSLISISEDIIKNDLIVDISNGSLTMLWKTYQEWVEKEREAVTFYSLLTESARHYFNGTGPLWDSDMVQEAREWKEANKINKFWARRYDTHYEEALDFLDKSESILVQDNKAGKPSVWERFKKMKFLAAIIIIAVVSIVSLGHFFNNEISDNTGQPETGLLSPRFKKQTGDEAGKVNENDNAASGIGKIPLDSLVLILAQKKMVPKAENAESSLAAQEDQQPKVPTEQESPSGVVDRNITKSGNSNPTSEIAKMEEMFWNSAQNALKYNNWLSASHFLAKVAGMTTDSMRYRHCVEDLYKLNRTLLLVSQITCNRKIYGANFSPHGELIVTWGADSSATVWSVRNGAPVSNPLNHHGDVWGAIFSPDRRRILTWSSDSTLRLWGGKDKIKNLQTMRHDDNVIGAEFSKTGELILSWGSDATARLWNSVTGLPAANIMKQPGGIKNAFFSHDDHYILTLGYDGEARVWSAKNGSLVSTFGKYRNRGQEIYGACFNHRDSRVLLWSHRNIFLWNMENMEEVFSPIELPYGMLEGACFSHNDRVILTWDGYQYARLWDAKTGKEKFNPVSHNGAVLGGQFSPTDNSFLSWGMGGAVRISNSLDGSPLFSPVYFRGVVRGAEFMNNGRYFLAWSHDGSARIWNAANGSPASSIILHPFPISGVITDSGKDLLLTWSGDDNTVKIWKTFLREPADFSDLPRADCDFPHQYLDLLVDVLTGTTVNERGNLMILRPGEWHLKKELYRQIAEEHWKVCRYKQANFYAKQKEMWGSKNFSQALTRQKK